MVRRSRKLIRLFRSLHTQSIVCFAVGAALAIAAVLYFPMCMGDTCTVQGWLSASSGWAAAFAAFYTIRLLYEQVSAQNKEIRFLLGENPPTIEIWRHSPTQVIIRVTNWNQIKFIVTGLLVNAPIPVIVTSINVRNRVEIDYYPILSGDIALESGGRLSKELMISGWENRNQNPEELFLSFQCVPSDGNYLKDDGREANITISGHYSGATRNPLSIEVTAPLREILTSEKSETRRVRQ